MKATATIQSSEAYAAYLEACRAGDMARKAEILDTQIARATDAEKAQWLLIKRESLAYSLAPGHWEMAWDALTEVLQLAPDDETVRAWTMSDALSFCLVAERFDRLGPFVALLQPKLRPLLSLTPISANIGVLRLRRREWRQAHRWLSRALRYMDEGPEHLRENCPGVRSSVYAWRCLAAVGMGDAALAAADLAVMQSLVATLPPQYASPAFFCLPEAELAFLQGRLQEARTALQRGREQARAAGSAPSPWDRVHANLLAARMARAEGNLVGFGEYCEQALAVCREHNLAITEQGVRAVMAGAER